MTSEGPLGPEHATARDLEMMDRALGLARTAATEGEVPVGAVVSRDADGAILGEGSNRREHDKDPSAHAEHLAIVRAARAQGDWRLEGCTLFVTLEPCVMCAGLIVNARVARVVYGARDPKAGACESLYRVLSDARLNHRPTVIAGVREDESARMLREFFRGLRAGGSEG
ncbi:MAG: nucleoside deaminase [Phycisphaerales bacterium]|nr:nucleoside deaminase [Phycisphaerales bacterium]